jgi:hypothetical protein
LLHRFVAAGRMCAFWRAPGASSDHLTQADDIGARGVTALRGCLNRIRLSGDPCNLEVDGLKTCRLILIGHRISPVAGPLLGAPFRSNRPITPPMGPLRVSNAAEAVRVCLSGTGRKERAHQHLILEPPRNEVRQPPMMGVRTLVFTKLVGGGVLLSSWVQLIANTQPRGPAAVEGRGAKGAGAGC